MPLSDISEPVDRYFVVKRNRRSLIGRAGTKITTKLQERLQENKLQTEYSTA